MNFIRKNSKGILLCLLIAVPSWFAGKAFPIIGGPVIAIQRKRKFCTGY